MQIPIDEATSQFLEAAADDLRRQLSLVGVVERIEAEPRPTGVALTVTIRVGSQTETVEGIGDSLVSAYADLPKRVAELALAAAFRNLYDAPIP